MTSTWWLLLLWMLIRFALFFCAMMATAVAVFPSANETERASHWKLMGATALWFAWWVWTGLVPETPTQQREHRERSPIVVVLAEST